MSFKCGIVGLPNVGKSTLFNALTNSNKAQAANFPFCTIDPNIGIVPVPDSRLNNLAKVSKSKNNSTTQLTTRSRSCSRSLFLRDNVNSDFELALLDKPILNSEIFASPLMLFGNVNCNKQWFRLSQ